jgi:hypothetical protein
MLFDAILSDPVAAATLISAVIGPCVVFYLSRSGSRRGKPQDPEREARETVYHGATDYIKRLEEQLHEMNRTDTAKDREINKLQRALGRAEGRNRRAKATKAKAGG